MIQNFFYYYHFSTLLYTGFFSTACYLILNIYFPSVPTLVLTFISALLYIFLSRKSSLSSSNFFTNVIQHSKRSHTRKNYAPWALVTGASGGIGGAIAIQLAVKGVNLFLTGRNHNALQQLIPQIHSANPNIYIFIIPIDLGTSEGCQSLFNSISQFLVNDFSTFESEDFIKPKILTSTVYPLPTLSILIFAAGFASFQSFPSQSLKLIESQISVNVLSSIRLCKLFLPLLKHNFDDLQEATISPTTVKNSIHCIQRSGSIVFVSSALSQTPVPYASVYCATKSFLSAFALSLRHEVGCWGISVHISEPSGTDTNFHSKAGSNQNFLRSLTPTQIAKDIVFAIDNNLPIILHTPLDIFVSHTLGLLSRNFSAQLFKLPMLFWASNTEFEKKTKSN